MMLLHVRGYFECVVYGFYVGGGGGGGNGVGGGFW